MWPKWKLRVRMDVPMLEPSYLRALLIPALTRFSLDGLHGWRPSTSTLRRHGLLIAGACGAASAICGRRSPAAKNVVVLPHSAPRPFAS